ncbi:hypothetical protein N0V88_002923 [Collariella sp. IMI 366227]|nr:hypothetical protein N0V88_002923 [Collariella sp. IMI 366227]
MRVLCLHGMGTSAFRSKLPPSITFNFIDGPHSTNPAAGITALFESQHYAWYKSQTAESIRTAHDWLRTYLATHGPYDAVMCFSQGCALIATFLLYHARETPDEPLPFKAAFFICGGMPLPVLEDLGVEVPEVAKAVNEATSRMLREKAGALTDYAENLEKAKRGVGLWDDLSGLLHSPDKIPEEGNVFGLDFTKMPRDLRITIPTVHVYGAKDPRWPASMQLAYFCEGRKMFDHKGGHDIPRSTEVSERLARLMVEMAKEIGYE